MLYKPNFCCNCGEKIERVEWNLLTSRRFCPACVREHGRHDYAPRIAIAAGALAVMFGFGSLLAGSQPSEPPAASQPVGIRSAVAAPAQQAFPPQDKPADTAVAPVQERTDTTGSTTTVSSQQPTYFCGALTKKGTPCSRKVKVKGTRCFQHEGRPEAARSE